MSCFPAGILWQLANSDSGPPADISVWFVHKNSPPSSSCSPHFPVISRPAAVFNKKKMCCLLHCELCDLSPRGVLYCADHIYHTSLQGFCPAGGAFWFSFSQRQHFSGSILLRVSFPRWARRFAAASPFLFVGTPPCPSSFDPDAFPPPCDHTVTQQMQPFNERLENRSGLPGVWWRPGAALGDARPSLWQPWRSPSQRRWRRLPWGRGWGRDWGRGRERRRRGRRRSARHRGAKLSGEGQKKRGNIYV